MKRHDDTSDPGIRPAPLTRRRPRTSLARALLGATAIIGLMAATASPSQAADAERLGTTRSQVETAQAELVGDVRSLAFVVTSVDYVTSDESGTMTAIDVFFEYGECLAAGPLDLTIDGLRHARLVGELAAECHDLDTNLSFDATVVVDLEWTGFGRTFQVPVISDPDDPCRSTKLQRRANVQGQITIDGADGGLQGTGQPVDSGFNALARQKDICRT